MIIHESGFVKQHTITNSMMQVSAPDSTGGRVLNGYIRVNQSTTPFGALFIGSLVQQLGASVTLKVSGLFCLIGFMTLRLVVLSIRSFNMGK